MGRHPGELRVRERLRDEDEGDGNAGDDVARLDAKGTARRSLDPATLPGNRHLRTTSPLDAASMIATLAAARRPGTAIRRGKARGELERAEEGASG
jgi:hypothetical protein